MRFVIPNKQLLFSSALSFIPCLLVHAIDNLIEERNGATNGEVPTAGKEVPRYA